MRRLTRFIGAAALVLTLAGCAVDSQSRKDEADAKARAAYARCDQQRLGGKYKSHLAAVECAVPTVVAAYQEAAYPFEDLIYLSVQARRAGARKVDTGEATEAEYQQDVAVLENRLAAEDSRRHDIMKYGGNPKPVPTEQLVQGLNAFLVTPTAAALPAAPAGCVPLGEIRTCK
jgi:hypothetical protein